MKGGRDIKREIFLGQRSGKERRDRSAAAVGVARGADGLVWVGGRVESA